MRPAPSRGDESSAARRCCQPKPPRASPAPRSCRGGVCRGRARSAAPETPLMPLAKTARPQRPSTPTPIASGGPPPHSQPLRHRPPGHRRCSSSAIASCAGGSGRLVDSGQFGLEGLVEQLVADRPQEHVELAPTLHLCGDGGVGGAQINRDRPANGCGHGLSDHTSIAASIPLPDRLSRACEQVREEGAIALLAPVPIAPVAPIAPFAPVQYFFFNCFIKSNFAVSATAITAMTPACTGSLTTRSAASGTLPAWFKEMTRRP